MSALIISALIILMKRTLLKELALNTVISCILYGLLFVVLYLFEISHPAIKGNLLQWNSLAFIVGIPASILGTAYVLTIKNPQNYTGFYPGIIMSLLLSWQFYLQGNYDLIVLYICIFIPFQLKSLILWRRSTLHPTNENEDFAPEFLNKRHFLYAQIVALLIVGIDYIVATMVINHDGWTDKIIIKVASGITIASSTLANYLMIYKKNDSWLCWVIFSIASIVLFVILGNTFSIMLFVVMLIINMNAQFAWLHNTHAEKFGWAGDEEYILKMFNLHEKIRIHRDTNRDIILQRYEQILLNKLEQTHKHRAKLLSNTKAVHAVFGHIVDVVNRRIFDGEIDFKEGKIIAIREAQVPSNARYILPGFYDSHIHIESTLLTPEHYARKAVEQGTIGVIADPHEIANVLGRKGVEYMMQSGNKVHFHFHWGAPSCVPATPFETSGAALNSQDLAEILELKNVYGLGEMMNIPGVLNRDPETMARIEAAISRGKPVDGHAPQLMGDALKLYCEAGIKTDHECTTLAQARARIKQGMYVQVREGSAACDLDTLAPIISEAPDHVMLCSDDKYPDEISNGYINEMCRRAVHRGIDVFDVLTAACVTPVRYYKLPHGLLQLGDPADFIMVDNLREFNLSETWIDGVQVVADGIFTESLIIDKSPIDTNYPNHFLAKKISIDDLHIPPEEGQLKVISTTEGSLQTKQILAEAKVENGNVVSDTEHDILKAVCLSRHSEAKPAIGFIHGFGLKLGAIASTIGHDSHNIIAIGATDEAIVKVVNALIDMKGGLIVYDENELNELMLPIAGLMSYRNGDKVSKRHIQLKSVASRIGCKYKAPFMTLAFMALPVIPELKLTDKGLFDTTNFEPTSLWKK